jgi:HNH endonuclease/Homeodomain-like domain
MNKDVELKRKDMDYVLSLIQRGILSIDEEGCIWRHATIQHGKLDVPRRSESVKSKGYLALTLQMPDGRVRSVMAHRVIWEWAHGPIPEGLQINHKDLNKQNNRMDNLELMTNLENIRHSHANGRILAYTYLRKQEGAMFKGKPLIGDKDRIKIREMRASGMTTREIATHYGRSFHTIWQVLKRQKNEGS